VPDTHDVRVTPGQDGGTPAASPAKDGYVYVTRRAHGAVGLVGARNMPEDDARRLVDRIADDLETCAVRVQARGELADGAVQLVAMAGPRGTAEVTDVRLAPGGPVAANALECIVAPLRATPFAAPRDRPAPAFAIEATWNAAASPPPDAGGAL